MKPTSNNAAYVLEYCSTPPRRFALYKYSLDAGMKYNTMETSVISASKSGNISQTDSLFCFEILHHKSQNSTITRHLKNPINAIP